METGAPVVPLQRVVHAYDLTSAGLLLIRGASADLLGRRRMFVAGRPGSRCSRPDQRQRHPRHDVSRARRGARVLAAFGIVTGAGLALGGPATGMLTDRFGRRSFFAAHAVVMGRADEPRS